MTRGQHAVLIIAALATAGVSPVSAQSVAPTLACVAPPGFARFDIPLKRVASRISARQPHGGTLDADNYALFSLAAGGRISGSDTDLMSEFSVRYLWY